MLPAALLVALFGLPGLTVLATASGNGAAPWPWPRAVVMSFALGMTVAGITAVALGAFGIYSLAHVCLSGAVITAAVAASGGFRLSVPFARASKTEAAGFFVVATLASVVLLGRPFEMLLGERDATVYTVSGIGLARQGSLVLRDRTEERIGPEAMRAFYPSPRGVEPKPGLLRLPWFVKYPGFYYVDADRREIIAQGLPLLPALIAIFYDAFDLGGAFAANNFIGVVAVLSVFVAGISLVGELAGTLGAVLLALNLIEVWAGRYPVAEILFQMLLFAGVAAYLRGDRLGRALAGLLLGATLFAKIEAALIFAPITLCASVAAMRRRSLPGWTFAIGYASTGIAAAIYATLFQSDYVRMAYQKFSSFESRMAGSFFQWSGSWMVAGLAVITMLAVFGLSLQSSLRRERLSRPLGRGLAIGVMLFSAYGYCVRPHLTGLVVGQGKTLIWLGWYVGPMVLLLGFAGLAHYLWTRANAENLFVLSILLTLSAIFLHFTFVNLLHIYMTRRFVPATLPLVLLFFAHAVTAIGASGSGRRRWLGSILSVTMFAGSLYAIVSRSRHLYGHREYPGLVSHFSDLAEKLKGEDLVFLSDRKTRNLLGPALEFVFGLKTLVVLPSAYQSEKDRIEWWIEDGTAIGALTTGEPLENVPGTKEFETIEHTAWPLTVLDETRDRFPAEFARGTLTISRYAAGPGSAAYHGFWKNEGREVIRAVCSGGVRLLGGNRFLVRHVNEDCSTSGVAARSMGYLVRDSEAARWQRTLQVYGAHFVRRDLGAVVLFDEIAPEPDADATRLAPGDWKVEASDGRGSEALALDGRLETRWGSRAPQRPGMTFTIGFAEPTDVVWVKIRMGQFTTDRARALAIETSSDGVHWNREELPGAVEGIRWLDGVPEENADGNLDLRLNARSLRGLRLVNLGESSRFDWSIAELEIDGRSSGGR